MVAQGCRSPLCSSKHPNRLQDNSIDRTVLPKKSVKPSRILKKYRVSQKFWEASRDLEEFGYELLRIDPIVFDSKYGPNRTRGRRALCECDAIFTLRCDIAQRLPVEHRMALAGFYAL